MTHDANRRIGLIFILLGAAALAAAALLAGRNFLEERRAEQNASQLLARIEQWSAQPEQEVNQAVLVEAPDDSPTVWDSYDVDGVLSIPRLGLELPVLSQYTEELLKVSPCVYQGLGGSEPERLVIAGHNYRSHFGSLDQLAPGDEITYRSLDKVETCFQVTQLVEIGAEDAALLEEGEWDLTLLTCNLDMSRRLLVRCDMAAPDSHSAG